ncbi:MAG: hypothetical protein SOZ34_08970 [Clostridia bacterium]|nr:hypothetical protein [Clostridia bacterium]
MFFKRNKKNLEVKLANFLRQNILYLHSLAEGRGFAKKGFIYNEGLLKVGEVWVKESLSAPFKAEFSQQEFLYSIATSNLQTGMIFGRKCGLGARNIDDISSSCVSLERSMSELEDLINDDLCISFEQWESFRRFIITKWSEIMKPYENVANKADYEFRLLLAYYLLGVSIGIEKYE